MCTASCNTSSNFSAAKSQMLQIITWVTAKGSSWSGGSGPSVRSSSARISPLQHSPSAARSSARLAPAAYAKRNGTVSI